MKKRVVILFTCLLVWASSLFAQDVPVGVIVAFKKGNSQGLDRYMGDKIDLIIQDRSSNADKQGAMKEINVFFSTNKVNGFVLFHQGYRVESRFIVGTLKTANGMFRVNCFFRRVQNKYVIHQIRIDKTNE